MRTALMCFVLVVPMGCNVLLTPQQQAEIETAERDWRDGLAAAKRVKDKIIVAEKKIEAIIEKVKAGEMPFAEGQDAIRYILAEKDGVIEDGRIAIAKIDAAQKRIRDVQAAGASWFSIVLNIAIGLLGGGSFLRQRSKIKRTEAAFGTVSRAIDSSTAAPAVAAEIVKAVGETGDARDFLKELHAAATSSAPKM